MKKKIELVLLIVFLIVTCFYPNILGTQEKSASTNECFFTNRNAPTEEGFCLFALIHTSNDFEAIGTVNPLGLFPSDPDIEPFFITKLFIREITKGTLYMQTFPKGTIELTAGSSFSPVSFGGTATGEKNLLIWTLTSLNGYGTFIIYT